MKTTRNAIGQMKVSQALPLIKMVAQQWSLPLSLESTWRTATRIINHSVKNN